MTDRLIQNGDIVTRTRYGLPHFYRVVETTKTKAVLERVAETDSEWVATSGRFKARHAGDKIRMETGSPLVPHTGDD